MPIKADISQGTLRVRIRPSVMRLIQICIVLIVLLFAVAESFRVWDDLRIVLQIQPILGPLVLSAVALASLYGVLRMLFSSELIILDKTTLEIEEWIFAFRLSALTFRNSTIKNLRYEERSGGRAGIQRRIGFDSDGERTTFAQRATRRDSMEIINKMLEVYKFPVQESGTEEF